MATGCNYTLCCFCFSSAWFGWVEKAAASRGMCVVQATIFCCFVVTEIIIFLPDRVVLCRHTIAVVVYDIVCDS